MSKNEVALRLIKRIAEVLSAGAETD